jgi:hypothetical protein
LKRPPEAARRHGNDTVTDDFGLDGAVGALGDVADACKGVGHFSGGAARLGFAGSVLVADHSDRTHREHENRRSGHPTEAVAPARTRAAGGGISFDGLLNVCHDPWWRVEFGKRSELREDLPSRRDLSGTARARVEVALEILGDGNVELFVEHGIDEIEGRPAAHGFNR